MSVKSIVLKVIVGLAVIASLGGLVYYLSIPEKEEQAEEISVLKENWENAVGVTVWSDNSFTMTKKQEGWVMEGMEGINVNNAYVQGLVKSLSELSAYMIVEENAESYSPYGLTDEYLSVSIDYGDYTRLVNIGNKTGNFYYVNTEKSLCIYAVSAQDLYMAFMDKMDYLDTTAFKADEQSIDYVSFNNIVLKKTGDEWQEEKPYSLLTDTSAVKAKVIEPVSSISSVDIVKKADAVFTDVTAVCVGLGDEIKEFFVSQGEESYVYFEHSEYAYKVDSSVLSFLSVTGFELLAKYVAPVSITEVREIKFISPEETVTLFIEAPSTQAPIFYKNGKEVTEESFRNFYRIFMGLTFKDEGVAYGESEYSVVITKESGEELYIDFIAKNDSEYAVGINSKVQFTIFKKSVTDVFDSLKNIEEV